MVVTLQKVDYNNNHTTLKDSIVPIKDISLKVKVLNPHTNAPTHYNATSSSLDFYSPDEIVVKPNTHVEITTNITI